MAVGNPLKLALFGRPVATSLSPLIHRRFAEALGVAIDYRAIDSGIDDWTAKLDAFTAAGGAGANLTVPLKQVAAAWCADRLDQAARTAGAVNTLMRQSGVWHGANTDGVGWLADLARLGIEISGRRVLILGAGGAVRGLIGPLRLAGPSAIVLLNRTGARADELARWFGGTATPIVAGTFESPSADGPFDLVVQATSGGHHGHAPELRRRWLGPDTVVYDLNYGFAHQAFGAHCADHSVPCYDGLGMLVEQAAESFCLWTGQRPDSGAVLAGLRKTLAGDTAYHSKMRQ